MVTLKLDRRTRALLRSGKLREALVFVSVADESGRSAARATKRVVVETP
jgi:hypothetical protein